MASRRIPARQSRAYARWALPAVGGATVLKAETPQTQRVIPGAEVVAETLPRESLEQQLLENIRAGRYAAGVSARQLESIVREAAREGYDEGYGRGFAKGQQEGHTGGRAEGLAAGRALIEDAASRLGSLLEALGEPLAAQDEALREALAELAIRIARAVVRTELHRHPDSIRAAVAEALAALPLGAGAARVYVAPDDLELLREFGAPERPWSLLTDPGLERGDCRIEAGDSVVDYTVSARFAELLEQLFGRAESSRDDNDPA